MRRLAEFVAAWEGFSAKPYLCPAGVLTIGFGRTSGDLDNPTTRDAEFEWLMEDLERRRDRVLGLLGPAVEHLGPHQVDALTSFAYNVGLGALERSSLLKKIRQGKVEAAAREFQRWVYADGERMRGLVRRRADERELFEFGDYGRGPNDERYGMNVPKRRPGEEPVGAEPVGEPVADSAGEAVVSLGSLAGLAREAKQLADIVTAGLTPDVASVVTAMVFAGVAAFAGWRAWSKYRERRGSA